MRAPRRASRAVWPTAHAFYAVLAPHALDMRFESNMSAVRLSVRLPPARAHSSPFLRQPLCLHPQRQHQHFNKLLNQLKVEQPALEISYEHLRLVDTFYAAPDGEKVRVTRDEKTGAVRACVRKVRLGDLNVCCPKRAVDWRVSVNQEIPGAWMRLSFPAPTTPLAFVVASPPPPLPLCRRCGRDARAPCCSFVALFSDLRPARLILGIGCCMSVGPFRSTSGRSSLARPPRALCAAFATRSHAVELLNPRSRLRPRSRSWRARWVAWLARLNAGRLGWTHG